MTDVTTLDSIAPGDIANAFLYCWLEGVPATQFKIPATDIPGAAPIETFQLALSDRITSLTIGDGKAAWPIPFDCTILEIFTSLTAAQSTSGAVTVDARLGSLALAATVFATKPSIDANEDTNLTGTVAILSTAAAVKGQTLFFDIDAAGSGAKGLIATILVRRSGS